MSKTKSFWDKVCEFCCSSRERERNTAYTGREKDDRKHKDALPPQDLDREYDRGQPPGGPRIVEDVEPLGDDSSSDEES